MKKLLLVLLTGFALAGVANASHAQHHRGGFHGPGAGFHGSGFHDRGFHHFHDGRFHDRFAVFLGAPFFWGPEFYEILSIVVYGDSIRRRFSDGPSSALRLRF